MSIAESLGTSDEQIAEFCRKWQIVEFSLFGSALRDDFRPQSDVDVLVTFAPDARHSLFDLVAMEEELSGIFGRKVDLLTRRSLRNPYFVDSVEKTRQLLYAA